MRNMRMSMGMNMGADAYTDLIIPGPEKKCISPGPVAYFAV